MRKKWQAYFWIPCLTTVVTIIELANFHSRVWAQIIPDDTLGAESSLVTPDNIKGIESERISGGAIRGSNLFHSFQEFNLGEGRGAYFANPAAIENIFSRVTGVNPSEIFGTLGVLGNANLFFLNPNGIIFGPNASLDVRGSFFGTTADSFTFPDGSEFSATNPDVPPLLTVNVQQPIGLRFEGESGLITNAADLAVDSGQTLTLVGGDVTLDGGKIVAPGGRVELGGLLAAGEIGLSDDGSLSFPDGVARADVLLTNEAEVNVRAGGGGSIVINSRNLEILGTSKMRAGIASGLGFIDSKAGDINIDSTETITLKDSSFISNAVLPGAVGDAGGINITTANLSLTERAQVNAITLGEGDGGEITINASDTILAEGEDQNGFNSGISSNVEGSGNAGGINITTANLSLTQGAQISASIFEEGNAGEITINASDTISVEGEDRDGFKSGIFSTVTQFGKGKAGGINITTTNLSLTQGGLITASTFGVGDAGGIKLTTANLSLTQGGTIGVSTFGVGDAGEITINASDTISAEGKDDGLDTGLLSQVEESGIFSRVGETGEGNAGGIILTTTNLSLTNEAKISVDSLGRGEAGNLTLRAKTLEVSIGAQIAVNSEGSGRGGNLDLRADSLTLDTGTITAETASNQGGNINLTLSDLLTLRNHSQITATAGTDRAGGDGGNIIIDASFIIAVPQENSDITANAFAGDGGNITINANGILGLEFRAQATPLSDITASSKFGQQGEVEINTSGIDPTPSLDNLPEETVEAEIAQGCQVVGGQPTLEFFALGRGGLPPSPDELFSSEIVIAEWIPLDLAEEPNLDEIVSETELMRTTILKLPCYSR